MANRKRPAWFDEALRAHKTGDEDRLVDTLEKVKDMLGDVWLGEASGSIKAGAAIANKDESGIHVHLHNGTKDDDDEPAPAEKSDDGLAARIDALEKAVAILAQREEPAAGPAKTEEKKTKDKARTKDAGKDDGEDDEEEDEDSDKLATKDADKDDDDDDDDDDDKKKKAFEKDKTKDSRTRATVGDSSGMRGAWQDVISRAEILAPGIRLPTFDAKQAPKTTFDAMCQFRRRVLTEALKEEDTKAAITSLVGSNLKLAQMTCDSVAMLYNGASELVKQSTRDRSGVGEGRNYNGDANMSLVDTVKMINQRNRAKFGIQ